MNDRLRPLGAVQVHQRDFDRLNQYRFSYKLQNLQHRDLIRIFDIDNKYIKICLLAFL